MKRISSPANDRVRHIALFAAALLLIGRVAFLCPRTAAQEPPPPDGFTLAQTISDQAQHTTIAFSGLAMMTWNLESQSFFPPGKVADYTGFQYLRDNDPIKAQVIELSRTYGNLDGENNYYYATVFAQVYKTMTDDRKADLTSLRQSIMSGAYSNGTLFDYSVCTTPFLYSSPIAGQNVLDEYILNTDYLCQAPSSVRDWEVYR
jgi:hypothetical protein